LKTLGLDPGFGRMGYGIVEKSGSTLKAVAFGVLETSSHSSFEKRLAEVHSFVAELIVKYRPDEAAVETLFFSKNVKTAIQVAQARGVILLALAQGRVAAIDISPQQVKMALVGNGKALKPQVQAMAQRLLNLKELPRPDDAADALALAVSAIHSSPLRRLQQKIVQAQTLKGKK
jgi:crossover junction endodeoxyribonuclease RuvC